MSLNNAAYVAGPGAAPPALAMLSSAPSPLQEAIMSRMRPFGLTVRLLCICSEYTAAMLSQSQP